MDFRQWLVAPLSETIAGPRIIIIVVDTLSQ